MISFSHIINPFPAREGSEHSISSAFTFAALQRAVDVARDAGIDVEVRAVVLHGDEGAVQPPAVCAERLIRTIQDIHPLRPVKPLPLIGDILSKGALGARANYLVYTNMDIVVAPGFYTSLRDLVLGRFGEGVPFVVYRRNVPATYTRVAQLDELYAEKGSVAYGFDCFVFPEAYLAELDLGDSCIGAGNFDFLLFIALDAVSGFRIARVGDLPLTFHIGNAIEWIRDINYLEHNLGEAMAAIARMRARYQVPADSAFARIERSHFLPNARIDSRFMRKLKRLPGVSPAVYRLKKLLGRTH